MDLLPLGPIRRYLPWQPSAQLSQTKVPVNFFIQLNICPTMQ
jgi:hypothetical protein